MAVDLFTICTLAFPLLLLYVIKTYFQARTVWEQFGTIPGRRALISEFSLLGKISGGVKYITIGWDNSWRAKHKDHEAFGWDAISSIGLWPAPQGGIIVADADAIKMLLSSQQKFPKPERPYRVLRFFGNNIITAEFEEWKRYRKISAPAFSEKNNKLAFGESVRSITSLYEGKWRGRQEIVVDDTLGLAMSIAIMTISAAGFGHRINWGDEEIPPGHKMSFKRTIEVLGTRLFVKLICPKWIFEWAPVESIREVRDGLAEFRSYLAELIESHGLRNPEDQGRDLLSNLINANQEVFGEKEQRLGEEELIGNAFMFYVAGNDTSGHTLCFALNMLAVHQEEQEALYQHIMSVLPDNRLPTYEDIPRLKRVTATLYETLRMFPSVPFIPKCNVDDTSIVVGNQAGDTTVFQIPAGTEISLDVAGLHYNPRYWKDPYTFDPERFLGKWNKDAFMPFSGGTRSCLGRPFFEVTVLATLTILMQHFKVEPHPKFSGDSFEQLKERYSQAKSILSLMPLCSSLVFKRRR